MSLAAILQAFLLADVFFVGVLAAVAAQHAIAHFRPRKQSASPATGTAHPSEYVSPMVRERLAKESEAKFQDALNHSATQLQTSLGSTAAQLDLLLKQLGAEIVGNELERYRTELSQLRKQAQVDMGAIKTEVEAHKAELEAQLQQELAAEKQRLIKQLDTKLADAVGSFLLETLQHNIDLGAQEAYLRTMLEEHKADFVQEVADESHAAK